MLLLHIYKTSSSQPSKYYSSLERKIKEIFKVLNKKMINPSHFEANLNRVLLKPAGRKIFVQAFEDRLQETIQHRTLNRSVSYKHLIKLECFKLQKHLLKIEDYKPFKMWW